MPYAVLESRHSQRNWSHTPCPDFTSPILAPTPTTPSPEGRTASWYGGVVFVASRRRVRSVVLAMTQGIGVTLTNEEKRAHLTDIGREYLVDHVCLQEVLPPED